MLARCALLCNDTHLRHDEAAGWQFSGDPTEGALLTLALKAGLDPLEMASFTPRADEIPFESEHRFMATLHHDHAGHAFVLLKGAPERVLALARCDIPAGTTAQSMADIAPRFILLGLVGIIDPPRDEAIAAVAVCQRAGLHVKMITGDHAITAAAIGRQLGLNADRALTGEAVASLDDDALRRAALETDVFARASPEHKLRLVAALQARGELVYLFNVRYFTAHAFTRDIFTGNPVALLVSVLSVGFQLLFTYAPPMQQVPHTAPLDGASWLLILALGLAKFLAVEAEKAVLRRLQVRSM